MDRARGRSATNQGEMMVLMAAAAIATHPAPLNSVARYNCQGVTAPAQPKAARTKASSTTFQLANARAMAAVFISFILRGDVPGGTLAQAGVGDVSSANEAFVRVSR